MGIMDFLDKAVDKASSYAKEAHALKSDYKDVHSEELMREFKKTSNITKKSVIGLVLQERGYKVENGKWSK